MAPISTQDSWKPVAHAVKQIAGHPLNPLTSNEITNAGHLVRSSYPDGTNLHFKAITLEEPAKAVLVPYLEAEHNGGNVPKIDRIAFVSYYIRNTDKLFEALVNLSSQAVEHNVQLGPNLHANVDNSEIIAVEKLVLADPQVKAAIAECQLPAGTTVVCDPWIYGSDGDNDDERMCQCFLYMRDPANPDDRNGNHYAFPLPISPVVDTVTNKIIRVDGMPTGADAEIKKRGPINFPKGNEYTAEYQKLRTDVKPLNVVQPQGASFKVTESGETGQVIEWQKWSFRHGFNQREGMVLYDVRYDGRSLFYRLSLSDMNIPYADPRAPFHRKSAFDLGDTGAGIMANNLKLGCDCLGSIHYLSGTLSDDEGAPFDMENVVCIHEQDAGIGWKHTNYRTGTAAVTRARELVLQSIITVANYEYILAFIFNQAGELTYEVRATGIVSTQPIDQDISVPWGTVVHPGVLASHHQHIFSLRIDPAIDGHRNSILASEAFPMEKSAFNPHGMGYTVRDRPITHSTGLDLDTSKNLTYKISNPHSLNPINGKPVAYKIHAPDFQKMLAHPDSFHHRRAEFADHNLYVTAHRDDELYAGGKYTNQSRGGQGVRAWANRKDRIDDSDLVVWVQFGLQHVTRAEDFPVMPCEILKVRLVPVNFFTRNPALDVPPATQRESRSTLLSGEGGSKTNGNGVVNGNGNGTAEGHGQGSVEARVGERGRVEMNGNGNANGNGNCCH